MAALSPFDDGSYVIWADWQLSTESLVKLTAEGDAAELDGCNSNDVTHLPWKLTIREGKVTESAQLEAVEQDDVDGDETDNSSIFAAAMEAYESFDLYNALKRLHKVICRDPKHQSALFNLASILHMLELPHLAVHYIERVIVLNPDDMVAHTFLWALTNTVEASRTGIEAYRRLAVTDIKAAHKLAALTGEGSAAFAGDPQYAKKIYDDMADRFESKLVDHLGYRGPWILREMVFAAIASGKGPAQPLMAWRVLDVGCGSGLCGRIFRNVEMNEHVESKAACTADATVGTEHKLQLPVVLSPGALLADPRFHRGPVMLGIDVSMRMAEITSKNGSYDAVVCGDLREALSTFIQPAVVTSVGEFPVSSAKDPAETETFSDLRTAPKETDEGTPSSTGLLIEVEGLDLVIAADTFIYVGILGNIFGMVHASLRCNRENKDDKLSRGGLFIFSIEDLDSSPMRLENKTATEEDLLSQNEIAQGEESGESASEVALSGPSQDIVFEGDEPVGAIPGWGAQLLSSARFAHSHTYIAALAERHGFTIVECRRHVLRYEGTVPLPGIFYVLEAR